ncbi:DUF1990 domain-containing protein [Streptomyces sp. MP131-18]|uniref:DUF1990 family protein n=1 Tax=Streptomyces sp. MP131-18 TaxID=1857892 RepID=UPI00097BCFED|nr:DUF1990 domain-containing protein [Streptomyces sp. MP131-18]ONK11790.1 hypothetical protein STBA_25260 [Streptomyces sp. MP131-18]
MSTDDFTYGHVGWTRSAEGPPPDGFHLLRARTRLGNGPAVRAAAGSAVLGWRMHRAAGLAVAAEAAEAAEGVRVAVGIGVWRLRLWAPCRVVWTVNEPDRAGFAYGTLPGHPERGEEAFLVERLPDDSVWLTVLALSRGAVWYTRAAGPLGRAVQRGAARGYGRALRRTVRSAGKAHGEPS